MARSATVRLGSYTGPAVGSFVVQSYENNNLVADVIFRGEPTITLQFDQYSDTP
jgi:hypothetical protein